MIEKRISEFRNRLANADFDTMMVHIAENRRYLSGFTGEDSQFDESAGVLFITAERLIIATDSRFEIQARMEAPQYEVYVYDKGLAKALPDIVSRLETRRLGFESVRVSCDWHRQFTDSLRESGSNIEWVDTKEMIERLRIAKSNWEIDRITSALHMAESAFSDLLRELRPGVTEKAVAWQLERRLREAGADALSFPVIVAAGPNSALPHAIPSERPLQKGEPILFDWGIVLDGYCSDISRTICIGTPDSIFEKVYRTVRTAQEIGIKTIQPGINGKKVDGAARKYIEDAGFKGKFGHGLGHGVGLAVHEMPRLSPVKDDMIEENTIVTVEPGIYIEGWGGVRLENMAVVQSDGARILNASGLDQYVIQP